MCFGSSGLKRHLFLVTQACEMSMLVTSFIHWNLLAGHLKPSTYLESPHLEHLFFSYMGLFRIKLLLVWWYLLFVFTWIPLVAEWSWLERLLLLLTWWEVCVLMSHQIDLGHLGVTCNLFGVMHCDLWCFHLLCKLPVFVCRELF